MLLAWLRRESLDRLHLLTDLSLMVILAVVVAFWLDVVYGPF